jgi:N-acetylglucosaminyldiphosphoundecaprenol N-acetyl-beta-D-mannosaminyltransferase
MSTVSCPLPATKLVPYPDASLIEDIPVAGFPNAASLFDRLVRESRQPGRTIVGYLNVHVANTAFHDAALKRALRQADLIYCDGAGVALASRLLGCPLPTRLTAADWFLDMLRHFARENRRVYLLGGEPGVPEKALGVIAAQIPDHTVVGAHHGFILNDAGLEERVIHAINASRPDILIVGFGTPLQELWIERCRDRLDVPVLYALGAVMDFVSGKVSRCPAWMGTRGLEWLYRLAVEPGRLAGRYLIGNPWFLARIAWQAGCAALRRDWRRPLPS